MAEVYVREVIGNPAESIRDVEVRDRQIYEKYKSQIRSIVEEAVSNVARREGSGYVIDKIYFGVKNGILYAYGSGPIAREAKRICIERYGDPEKKKSGSDGAAEAVAAVSLGPLFAIIAGLLMG